MLTSLEHMSDADVALWREEYLALLAQLDKQAKVLTYAGNLTVPFTSEQREVIARTIKEARPMVFKSAIYGLSLFVKIIFQIVCAVGARRDIRIFNTEEEALHWLNE